MTPKQKAEELISVFLPFVDEKTDEAERKQSSKIAVTAINNIMFAEYNRYAIVTIDTEVFWRSVRNELRTIINT